jgi:hypothetical protein
MGIRSDEGDIGQEQKGLTRHCEAEIEGKGK